MALFRSGGIRWAWSAIWVCFVVGEYAGIMRGCGVFLSTEGTENTEAVVGVVGVVGSTKRAVGSTVGDGGIGLLTCYVFRGVMGFFHGARMPPRSRISAIAGVIVEGIVVSGNSQGGLNGNMLVVGDC